MSQIPLVDLRAQYRAIKPEIDRAILRVVDRGQFILGPQLEALEREIAAYCGTTHAVGVASGTDALELALRACGVGPGHEVLTSAYSFFATAEAILAVGAVPVFVDIDPITYTLDPSALEAKVTPKTKAIIPVHLYGHPCAMDPVMALARARHLKVIEDCAQAIGARYHGRPVGSFGHAAAFSFYPTKNLGGYGEGGMVATRDAAVAERVRLLRNHGSRTRYHHRLIGTNSRLDELQAAVLRVKLRPLASWTARRRRLAKTSAALFRRHGLRGIVVPQELPGCRHVYHLYTIRLPRRAQLIASLARAGIATQVAYPSPLPAQPALRGHRTRRGRYPVAERLSRSVVSLPIYPELTDRHIHRIVGRIARAVQ